MRKPTKFSLADIYVAITVNLELDLFPLQTEFYNLTLNTDYCHPEICFVT